jgi:hypothetical protein
VGLAADTVGLAAWLCATESVEAELPQAETVSARAVIAIIFFILLLLATFCLFLSNTGKRQDWDISIKVPSRQLLQSLRVNRISEQGLSRAHGRSKIIM